MGPFRSPLPYDLKTGILYKSSVAQGKRAKSPVSSKKDVQIFQLSEAMTKVQRKRPGISSMIPMASANSICLRKMRSLLEMVSVEVDRLVDNPEGDFQLLGSSDVRKGDLDGDHDGVDPSYFNQDYLGP